LIRYIKINPKEITEMKPMFPPIDLWGFFVFTLFPGYTLEIQTETLLYRREAGLGNRNIPWGEDKSYRVTI
jgi:hypothetical protein